MLTTKTFVGLMAATLTMELAAAEITQVTVQQRWPWSRLVNIDYVLSGESSEKTDITINGTVGAEAVDIPESSLSGDLYGVSGGPHRIVWDPTQTACTNNGVLPDFRVSITLTPSPVYMIVDLTNAVGTLAQVEYIYPGDSRLVTDGRYTNVWFDMTNDIAYKTDKLVLRRVHAGSFKMGSSVPPTLPVTLTKDFYVGVFEVTQAQWKNIMGSYPAHATFTIERDARAAECVSYDSIRGATNNSPVINWPLTGRAVSSGSFLGKLRARSGIDSFDLPTEAQWNYACRAGTTTLYNDGDSSANVSGANAVSNEWLNVLGRYAWNGGKYWDGDSWENASSSIFGPTNGTAIAGSYQPNNWGLYDTLGNVWDLCLDWYGTLQGGTDPAGNTSGSQRVGGGGRLIGNASDCTSGTRGGILSNSENFVTGFRVVYCLP